MQAGVSQRIERYGRFVRYAEHDKIARVGYPIQCVKDAPYLNPNPLKQKGKRVYEIDDLITITIDVDSTLTVGELRAALPNLPVNYAVGRATGDYSLLVRPHLIFEMEFAVKRFPQTPSEIADKQKFDRIVDEIATRLVAAGHHVDAVNMTNVKNPDYEHWDTYTDPNAKTWTLKELLVALGMHGAKAPETLVVSDKVVSLADVRRKGWKAEVRGLQLDLQDDGSRNKQTFLHVREAICEAFRDGMGEQVIHSICEEAANQINATFSSPLKSGEISSICRSITKYMLAKGFERRPSQQERKRGAAAYLTDGAENTAQKQSRGARYTHAVRNQKNLERVQQARISLGENASKAAVARYLKMTRETVGKYWDAELSQLPAIQTAAALQAQNVMLFEDWVKHRLPLIGGGVGYGAIRETDCPYDAHVTPPEAVPYDTLINISVDSDDKRVVYLYQHYLGVARQCGDLGQDQDDLPEPYVDAIRFDLLALG